MFVSFTRFCLFVGAWLRYGLRYLVAFAVRCYVVYRNAVLRVRRYGLITPFMDPPVVISFVALVGFPVTAYAFRYGLLPLVGRSVPLPRAAFYPAFRFIPLRGLRFAYVLYAFTLRVVRSAVVFWALRHWLVWSLLRYLRARLPWCCGMLRSAVLVLRYRHVPAYLLPPRCWLVWFLRCSFCCDYGYVCLYAWLSRFTVQRRLRSTFSFARSAFALPCC